MEELRRELGGEKLAMARLGFLDTFLHESCSNELTSSPT